MPCSNAEHHHEWPEEGELVIEKCEKFCGYCTGVHAYHQWKYSWFLRRHVRTVHLKPDDKPNVQVSSGWSEQPDGLPKTPSKVSPEKAKTPRSTGTTPKSAGVKKSTTTKKKRRSTQKKNSGIRTASPPMIELPRTPSPDKPVKTASEKEEDDYEFSTPAPVLRLAGLSDQKRVASVAPSMAQDQSMVIDNPFADLSIHYAFRTAVEDLTNQGMTGGLDKRDIALIMTSEADRLARQVPAVQSHIDNNQEK